jgi:hypothetical protein
VAAHSEARWATAVRVLAIVAAVLLTIAIAEARALRAARVELQKLRAECPQTVR